MDPRMYPSCDWTRSSSNGSHTRKHHIRHDRRSMHTNVSFTDHRLTCLPVNTHQTVPIPLPLFIPPCTTNTVRSNGVMNHNDHQQCIIAPDANDHHVQVCVLIDAPQQDQHHSQEPSAKPALPTPVNEAQEQEQRPLYTSPRPVQTTLVPRRTGITHHVESVTPVETSTSMQPTSGELQQQPQRKRRRPGEHAVPVNVPWNTIRNFSLWGAGGSSSSDKAAQPEATFAVAYKYGIAVEEELVEKEIPGWKNMAGVFIVRFTEPAGGLFFSFGFSGFILSSTDAVQIKWFNALARDELRRSFYFLKRLDKDGTLKLHCAWHYIDAARCGARLIAQPSAEDIKKINKKIEREIDVQKSRQLAEADTFNVLMGKERESKKRRLKQAVKAGVLAAVPAILTRNSSASMVEKQTFLDTFEIPPKRKLQQFREECVTDAKRHARWMAFTTTDTTTPTPTQHGTISSVAPHKKRRRVTAAVASAAHDASPDCTPTPHASPSSFICVHDDAQQSSQPIRKSLTTFDSTEDSSTDDRCTVSAEVYSGNEYTSADEAYDVYQTDSGSATDGTGNTSASDVDLEYNYDALDCFEVDCSSIVEKAASSAVDHTSDE